MKTMNVEMLMGYNIGLAESYYRPTEQDLLNDYPGSVGTYHLRACPGADCGETRGTGEGKHSFEERGS
jgi:hypothetical protein